MRMCRFSPETRNGAAIRRLFQVPRNRTASIDPQTSIFPGYSAPVIRKAEDGERELVHMTWGSPYSYAAPPRAYGYAPPPAPNVDVPAYELLPPPPPANCGEYHYWNGEYCADARYNPPYLGPRW